MTTTASNTYEPTTSGDPYARASELGDDAVSALAARFEIRAADPRQRALWRDFLSRAPQIAAARVLEVGCGTGIITALVAELPGVTQAVGVDPIPGFVELARRRVPALRFEVADGRSLPFADESFDGVVFATTLCHVPTPERALGEARRVLRPGGYLLIYDGDYATTTVAVGANDPLQTCVDAAISGLVHDPWLVRRLPRLVRDAGFEPGQLRSHGYVELDSPAYLPSMIDVGVRALQASATISPPTATALRAEAQHRADSGRFYGHIAYASLLAHAPSTGAA